MKKYSRKKDSVDLEVIVWLRHSIVLGPYYGSIQPCIMVWAVCLSIFLLCATITRCKYSSHAAGTVLYLQVPSPLPASTVLNPSTSKSQYRSLYTGPSYALYSLSKASRDCTSILKCFHALFLPLCTLIQCLVLAMPPQSLKIDHLPSDASAILREGYLAGTFSVVTQWLLTHGIYIFLALTHQCKIIH